MKINPKSFVLFDYTGTYSVVPKPPKRLKEFIGTSFDALYKSCHSYSAIVRSNIIVDMELGEVLKNRYLGFRRAKYYPWFAEQIKNLLEK